MFDYDPVIPSYEIKRIVQSRQVDDSHISGGQFCWPFAMPPLITLNSFSGSSSTAGHRSSKDGVPGRNVEFKFIVTIYRRGRLRVAQTVEFVTFISCREGSLTVYFDFRLTQKILYIPPPDSQKNLSPSIPDCLPRRRPAISSWPQQRLPAVSTKGIIFGKVPVEVGGSSSQA